VYFIIAPKDRRFGRKFMISDKTKSSARIMNRCEFVDKKPVASALAPSASTSETSESLSRVTIVEFYLKDLLSFK
jgi:hypothetical protein